MSSTSHLHRHRLPRGHHMKTKVHRPPALVTLTVTPPYRAEHRKMRWIGPWRDAIEDAIEDGRKNGNGSRIYSSEHVLLAKFDNTYAKETAESRRQDREEDDHSQIRMKIR